MDGPSRLDGFWVVGDHHAAFGHAGCERLRVRRLDFRDLLRSPGRQSLMDSIAPLQVTRFTHRAREETLPVVLIPFAQLEALQTLRVKDG